MEVNNLSDIDTIMNMLDWNNSSDEQNRGIKLAENIESINVFYNLVIKSITKMFGIIVQLFYQKDQTKN